MKTAVRAAGCTVGLLFLLVLATARAADEPRDASLRGLKRLYFAVESFDEDASKDGIDIAEIQATAETRLMDAGIRLATLNQFASDPTIPVLYLDVGLRKRPEGFYIGLIRLQLLQNVYLARDQSVETPAAITWEVFKHGVTGAANLRNVRDDALGLIDQFVVAFRKRNPPNSSEQTDRSRSSDPGGG